MAYENLRTRHVMRRRRRKRPMQKSSPVSIQECKCVFLMKKDAQGFSAQMKNAPGCRFLATPFAAGNMPRETSA